MIVPVINGRGWRRNGRGWFRKWLLLVALLGGALSPEGAHGQTRNDAASGLELMDVHAVLGALSTSLVVGAASGNLGKLMDPRSCCPDGGARDPLWRTTDRVLVTTGIVTYSGAAALALYNLLIVDPPSSSPRAAHDAHRWLALGHGAAFLTSAVTGIIMQRSQSSDPERFARAARIHTASNLVLVPVLTLAFSDILWE
jgi:hypothetical protein